MFAYTLSYIGNSLVFGRLPKEIALLKDLKYLKLTGCYNLYGEFPVELAELSVEFNYLYLGGTRITIPPKTFFKLAKQLRLEVMYLPPSFSPSNYENMVTLRASNIFDAQPQITIVLEERANFSLNLSLINDDDDDSSDNRWYSPAYLNHYNSLIYSHLTSTEKDDRIKKKDYYHDDYFDIVFPFDFILQDIREDPTSYLNSRVETQSYLDNFDYSKVRKFFDKYTIAQPDNANGRGYVSYKIDGNHEDLISHSSYDGSQVDFTDLQKSCYVEHKVNDDWFQGMMPNFKVSATISRANAKSVVVNYLFLSHPELLSTIRNPYSVIMRHHNDFTDTIKSYLEENNHDKMIFTIILNYTIALELVCQKYPLVSEEIRKKYIEPLLDLPVHLFDLPLFSEVVLGNVNMIHYLNPGDSAYELRMLELLKYKDDPTDVFSNKDYDYINDDKIKDYNMKLCDKFLATAECLVYDDGFLSQCLDYNFTHIFANLNIKNMILNLFFSNLVSVIVSLCSQNEHNFFHSYFL